MSDADSLFAPGTIIGRYQIVRLLGQGGMGAVYEGVHLDLKRRVAIKTLHRSAAENPEVRARFIREGEAASRIRHPNIVDIYDVNTHEGAPYLVMEYLDGEDLAQLVRRHGALAPADIADVMLPVLAALATAHENGIIHRDLKPANVFLSYSPHGELHPKVLDFGISKITDEAGGAGHELTKTTSMLGTPSYMSPEQAQGAKHVDARTDQYSLGVIMYQCAVGDVPFHADSLYQLLHSIVQGQFVPPRQRRPELPEGFERVIMCAMARLPEQRFDSVRTLARALLPFASERGRLLWERTFGAPLDPAAIPLPSTGMSGIWTNVPAPVPAAQNTTLSGSTAERALPAVPATRGRSPLVFALPVVLLGALGVAGYFAFGRAHAPASTTSTTSSAATGGAASYVAAVSTAPASAQIRVDGEVVGTGSFTRQYAQNGVTHTMLVTAEGFEPRSLTFREPPPGLIELVPRATAPAPQPVALAAPAVQPVAPAVQPVAPAVQPVAPAAPAVQPAAPAVALAPAAAPVEPAPAPAAPESHNAPHHARRSPPSTAARPPHRTLVNGAPIIR